MDFATLAKLLISGFEALAAVFGATGHAVSTCAQVSAVVQFAPNQSAQFQIGPAKFAAVGNPPECPAG